MYAISGGGIGGTYTPSRYNKWSYGGVDLAYLGAPAATHPGWRLLERGALIFFAPCSSDVLPVTSWFYDYDEEYPAGALFLCELQLISHPISNANPISNPLHSLSYLSSSSSLPPFLTPPPNPSNPTSLTEALASLLFHSTLWA